MAKRSLQFYKKGVPVGLIGHAILFIVVLVISTGFFEFFLNYEGQVKTKTMGEPTLPLVTANFMDGTQTLFHGYVRPMDACYMRDAIVPINEDRTINIEIDPKRSEIDSVSYEVRSLNTSRKISGNELKCSRVGGKLNTTLQIENLIEKGEEYLLILNVISEGTPVYYYTRIMTPEDDYHTRECLDFVLDFHDKLLSDNYRELTQYIETDEYSNKQTLNNVTIKSSISQLGYEGFDGEVVDKPYVSITDTTNTFTTIVLKYQMVRSAGRYREYYNVEEYFRVSYGKERLYLIDYQRNMEQMLNARGINVSDNKLNIGLTSDNVQYLSNETGTVVAFVQAGELFLYNQNDQVLAKVFSFIGEDATDVRTIYNQHKIVVLNIDESGTMDYVVYGYLNNGSHEGQCGINLFHYDSVTKKSTEQIFIPSTASYQILNANFSQLLYETANYDFYIMVDGTLIKMNLNDMSSEELLKGMSRRQYAVSTSGRYLAWIDEVNASDRIHVLDLETQKTFDIKAASDSVVMPLDFIDNDLVYGTVYKDNMTNDGKGAVSYPMHRVTIAGVSDGEELVKKSYRKDGYYITDVKIDGYTIYLERVMPSSTGELVAANNDTIKNSAGEINKAVPILTAASEIKGEDVILLMAPLVGNEHISRINFAGYDVISTEATKEVNIETESAHENFYVYVGNNVTESTESLKNAVKSADEQMGIVVNNEQRYIWKRGKANYTNAFAKMSVGSSDVGASSSAGAISAMLVREGDNTQVYTLLDSGLTPIEVLERTLKDYRILDLTGLSLSQVLYYVSIGNSVYAKTGDNEAVLLIGYDAATVIVYNPRTDSRSRMNLSDAEELFASNGSVYISYVK